MDRNEAIEIPFGAKDSELKGWEYTIPEGMEAIIENGKIIVREKESEDERIRKAIGYAIGQSTHSDGTLINGISSEEALAWLEKQGEQKEYNICDTCENKHGCISPCPVKLIGQKSTLPDFEQQEGVAGRDYIPVEWVEAIENYGKWKIVRTDEQNPAWSEEDEKILGKCIDAASGYYSPEDKQSMKDWLRAIKDRVQPKPAWSGEDETGLNDAIWAIEQARTTAKDENDMGNLWYAERWLKSLKSRVQPQPKSEWSEEDENKLRVVTSFVNSNPAQNPFYDKVYLKDWLKSLKERYTWKPSEEQLEALGKICEWISLPTAEILDEIRSLYNDLKRLKR